MSWSCKLHRAQARLSGFFSSSRIRLWLLASGFILLLIARQMMGSFGVSLGYVYVFLISLAGLWFGVSGGIIAATVSAAIFLVEVSLLHDWPGRALVAQGLPLRLIVYYLEGIILGSLGHLDRKLAEEKKLKEHLKTLAYRDELTGCLNYRRLIRKLDLEILRASRSRKDMVLILADIDRFKLINDKHGHLCGNQALQVFTEALTGSVRTMDIVGRYGGDEFLVVLPETGPAEAAVVLARMKQFLSRNGVVPPGGGDASKVFLTFSAGIAAYPANGLIRDDLIFAADNALYQAKRNGRNQIVTERRRDARIKPLPHVRMELGGCFGEDRNEVLRIVNVSRSGMLVLHPWSIPQGELCFRFICDHDDLAPGFKCRIVHQQQVSGNLFRLGLSFIAVPNQVLEKLFVSEEAFSQKGICNP